MLFLGLRRQGLTINEIFWGLWLFPFGVLVMRSGFLPRVLGVWLIVNCFAYLALSFTGLLLPQHQDMGFRIASPVLFGEIAIALWLLIKEADQLQTLARLHLAASFDAYYVGLPFWGLASTVCSYLWFKSRYIPRALAAVGVISSAWCVICAFAFIVFPHFDTTVNAYWFDLPMVTFEMALGFWLLLKGLRPSGVAEPEKASA